MVSQPSQHLSVTLLFPDGPLGCLETGDLWYFSQGSQEDWGLSGGCLRAFGNCVMFHGIKLMPPSRDIFSAEL